MKVFICILAVALSGCATTTEEERIIYNFPKFNIAYEDMGFRESGEVMMYFFDEKYLRSSFGSRGALFHSFGLVRILEKCDYGDVLCLMDDDIIDIPIVISTDLQNTINKLSASGYIMSDLSVGGGHCRKYRISKKNIADSPDEKVEYSFCSTIGVTAIYADSKVHGNGGEYILRSYKGLGGDNIDKFNFGP